MVAGRSPEPVRAGRAIVTLIGHVPGWRVPRSGTGRTAMRRLLGLLGLLAVGGLAASMLVAYREKLRRGEQAPFDETAEEIDLSVIFDNLDATSRAQAFRGGKVDLWYGGGKLDLRQAMLDPAGADLRVRAIFGGLEIDVPPSWAVDVRGRAFFGGVGGARGAGPIDEVGTAARAPRPRPFRRRGDRQPVRRRAHGCDRSRRDPDPGGVAGGATDLISDGASRPHPNGTLVRGTGAPDSPDGALTHPGPPSTMTSPIGLPGLSVGYCTPGGRTAPTPLIREDFGRKGGA